MQCLFHPCKKVSGEGGVGGPIFSISIGQIKETEFCWFGSQDEVVPLNFKLPQFFTTKFHWKTGMVRCAGKWIIITNKQKRIIITNKHLPQSFTSKAPVGKHLTQIHDEKHHFYPNEQYFAGTTGKLDKRCPIGVLNNQNWTLENTDSVVGHFTWRTLTRRTTLPWWTTRLWTHCDTWVQGHNSQITICSSDGWQPETTNIAFYWWCHWSAVVKSDSRWKRGKSLRFREPDVDDWVVAYHW